MSTNEKLNTIFKDKNGNPLYVLGLQSHNSSNGCWEMIDKSIAAVKQYHGNTLEVPVCWYHLEPEEGKFDFSLVEALIQRVRASGLYLVILWFGFSKNASNVYLPDWAKLDTERFFPAVGPDGCEVTIISPNCDAIYEADKKAFAELIKGIKRVDEKEKTVIGIQVENELGLYTIDRCYSKKAQEDFDKGVPPQLDGVTLEDSGASGKGNSWYDRFGRHAHEAFSAWHFGIGVEKIAKAGKEIYPSLPLYTNTMIGEIRQEVAGQSYSSGSPVGRVLDIWKKAAPSLDLIAPDIYQPFTSGYIRVANLFNRPDNPLFIPETGTQGDNFAMHIINAAVDYKAIGICGFGAESTVEADWSLKPEAKKVAASMSIIKSMSPILLNYANSGKIFCVTQEQYQAHAYFKREKYHVTFYFTSENLPSRFSAFPRSFSANLRVGTDAAKDPDFFVQSRGRAIVYEKDPYDFYIAGIGLAARFLKRTEIGDLYPHITNVSPNATEKAAFTIEEGHFTDDCKWVCEAKRSGDELNPGALVYPGIVLRVKLNPNVCKPVLYKE